MSALSIDTATNICAVAITDMGTGKTLARQSDDIGRGHAEILMAMITCVLDRAGLELSQINQIISSTGPGSFTGVRVGLAAARGIGLGLSVPVVGVSNLQACAQYCVEISKSDAPVLVAIDARREQVYAQLFLSGSALNEAVVCEIDHIGDYFDEAIMARAQICGSGAALVLERAQWASSAIFTPVHDRATAPIETIAALGIAASIGEKPPEPIYLRGADAKQQQGFAVGRLTSMQDSNATGLQ